MFLGKYQRFTKNKKSFVITTSICLLFCIFKKKLTNFTKKRTYKIILMDDNFSPQVRDVITYSKEEAMRLGHDFIGTEHLLLGLIKKGDGKAIEILATQRLPNLKVENYRSIRVYMTAIQHNFNIDPETISAYIDLYERARFGSRASSEADFGNFVIVLLEIMKNIRSGWNNSDEVLSRSTRSRRGGILQHKNRLFNAGGGRLRGLSGSSRVLLRRGGTHSSANSFVTGE